MAATEVEEARREFARKLKGELQRWLDNPYWPEFGPGIGHGPQDNGKVAARTTVQQVMNTIDDLLIAPEVFIR